MSSGKPRIPYEIKEVCRIDAKNFKIRNNRLWGIKKNNTGIYVDLRHPAIIALDGTRKKEFKDFRNLFVDFSGQFCLMSSELKSQNVLFSRSEEVPNIRDSSFVNPNGAVISSACFMKTDKSAGWYVGRGNGIIEFVPETKNESAAVHIIGATSMEPIIGLCCVPISEAYLLRVIVKHNFIESTVIHSNGFEVEQWNGQKTPVDKIDLNTEILDVHANEQLLTYRTDTEIVVYRINRSFEQIKNALCDCRKYLIGEKAVLNWCIIEDFIWVWNGRTVWIYGGTCPDPLTSFDFEACLKNIEYDETSKTIFVGLTHQDHIGEINLSKLVLAEEYQSISEWIYKNCIENKDYRGAIHVASVMGVDIERFLKQERDEDIQLGLYKAMCEEMLKRIDHTGITGKLFAIAQITLDFYVRVGVKKKECNTEEFVEFTKKLVQKKVITHKQVIQTLEDYGWFAPIAAMNDYQGHYEKLIEIGKTEEALELLEGTHFERDAKYRLNVLRAFRRNPKMVSVLASKLTQDELSSLELTPVVASEEWSEFAMRLLPTTENPLLARIFAYKAGKNPNQTIIEEFFRSRIKKRESSDISFMIRCLLSNNHLKELAYGLRAHNDLLEAAVMAVRADPELARSFITVKLVADGGVKRVLKSLPEEMSRKLARELLENHHDTGVDLQVLLPFLPDDLQVAELDEIIAQLVCTNKEKEEQENRKVEESLRKIDEIQQLRRNLRPKVVRKHATEPCAKCHRPLFGQFGLLFPCGHSLHIDCASEITNNLSDCPLCGFQSVRLIDTPLSSRQQEFWSVDF